MIDNQIDFSVFLGCGDVVGDDVTKGGLILPTILVYVPSIEELKGPGGGILFRSPGRIPSVNSLRYLFVDFIIEGAVINEVLGGFINFVGIGGPCGTMCKGPTDVIIDGELLIFRRTFTATVKTQARISVSYNL